MLASGKVLVAGGGYATAELYDPASGTFSDAGSMEIPRINHTATLLSNGKVLLIGGFAGPLSTAEAVRSGDLEFYPYGRPDDSARLAHGHDAGERTGAGDRRCDDRLHGVGDGGVVPVLSEALAI